MRYPELIASFGGFETGMKLIGKVYRPSIKNEFNLFLKSVFSSIN